MNRAKGILGLLIWGATILLLAGCAVEKKPRAEKRAPAPTATSPEAAVEVAAPPVAVESKTYARDLKPYFVKAVGSSQESPKTPAEAAFDGDGQTRWASLFRDGEWLEGYFDRSVMISNLTISWEAALASDFSVYLLDKSTNWIRVGQVRNNSQFSNPFSFPRPLAAHGVRVVCERRATKWGVSIRGLDAQGMVEGPPPERSLLDFELPATPLEAYERKNAKKLLAEAAADPPSSQGLTDAQFLDLVAKRSFYYFWYETNPSNGLTRDRGRNFGSSEEASIASVAAVGFALTAYAIGAEHGWVSREDAVQRVRVTLKTFANGPIDNHNGMFPHFVDMVSGKPSSGTEVSTIDTALFLAGMIVAKEYFNDGQITALTKVIFERTNWEWARNKNAHFVSHGLNAGGQFIDNYWGTTTEGILIYLLALGSPTHPLPVASWDAIDRHLDEYAGYRFSGEYGNQSIFRFQYPALWYDFRGKVDRSGLDYFENGTRATLAMREYCIRKAADFPKSYGPDAWGLGAADGPGDQYMIYGFPPGEPYSPTDGTLVPYAIAGSTPFLPQHCIRALRKLYDEHRNAWGKYGFADSVNPQIGFVARDALGLDAGTILLGIENYRSQFVWKYFMRNEWVRKTTQKIAWKMRPKPTDLGGPVDLARNGSWRVRQGDGSFAAADLDTGAWRPCVVPDLWENTGPEFAGYDGIGWYRTEFELSTNRLAAWAAAGRPVTLTLGAVDDSDEAFVNGAKVGATTEGGDLYRRPRHYRVPAGCLRAGRNVVAIRVKDEGGNGGIWVTPVQIGPE